jgi:hypothetical protein
MSLLRYSTPKYPTKPVYKFALHLYAFRGPFQNKKLPTLKFFLQGSQFWKNLSNYPTPERLPLQIGYAATHLASNRLLVWNRRSLCLRNSLSRWQSHSKQSGALISISPYTRSHCQNPRNRHYYLLSKTWPEGSGGNRILWRDWCACE